MSKLSLESAGLIKCNFKSLQMLICNELLSTGRNIEDKKKKKLEKLKYQYDINTVTDMHGWGTKRRLVRYWHNCILEKTLPLIQLKEADT